MLADRVAELAFSRGLLAPSESYFLPLPMAGFFQPGLSPALPALIRNRMREHAQNHALSAA